VIGLVVPGTDLFAIDVSPGATRDGNSVRRRGAHAEVIGIEVFAVMLGRPQPPGLFIGERDGGFVVAHACG
jgi:hypothetical protein